MPNQKSHIKNKVLKENIDLICESGFPLQKAIERLFLDNNSIFYPHQTEIPLNVPPQYASTKFIPPSLDLLVCQHSREEKIKWSVDVLLECKKAYNKEWHFFSKQSGSYYSSDKMPLSAVVRTIGTDGLRNEFKVKSIYCKTASFKMDKPPVVCDNIAEFQYKEDQKKISDRQVAYETCGTLSVALFHFLDRARASGQMLLARDGNPDDVSLMVPMVVTTANLFIVASPLIDVDLTVGTTRPSSIKLEAVPWVFFEFPIMSTLRNFIEPESNFYDFGKDLVTKMGCIIVNADSILNCLSFLNPSFVNRLNREFLSPEYYGLFV